VSDLSGSSADFAEFDEYAPGRQDAGAPSAVGTGGRPRGSGDPDDPDDPGTTDTTDTTDNMVGHLGAPDVDNDALPEVGETTVSEQLERPSTGNEGVDSATAALDALDELPTSEHAEVFDEVHRRLQGALADLDAG
jgi:hypothetical protein